MELNGAPVEPAQLGALALSNYGHFTSMRVDNGAMRGLSLHLERLARDCRAVFAAQLDPSRVRHLVRHAIAAQTTPVVVRVTLFDPALEFGHPGVAAEPQILVTTRPAAAHPLPPLRVRAVEYSRDVPAVKHVGLFGLVHQRRLAQLDGYDDVVFTDEKSRLSEGATWNIGFFDGDRIIWPEADILPGVTMALLNQAHHGPIDTAPIDLTQLPDMKAVFATNAAIGVRTIRSIDTIEWIAEHSVIELLRKEYADTPAEPL